MPPSDWLAFIPWFANDFLPKLCRGGQPLYRALEGGLDGQNIHHLDNAPVVDPGANPLNWPKHRVLDPNVPINPAPVVDMPMDTINRDDVWRERKANGAHKPATLGRILGKIIEALNKDIVIKNALIAGTSAAPTLKTDTINEFTPTAGVTIDSVPLKDGLVDGVDLSDVFASYQAPG